tara:strand:- start:47 stop:400 length:354 start_codon:yes stop_codon:yes gene_type:complete
MANQKKVNKEEEDDADAEARASEERAGREDETNDKSGDEKYGFTPEQVRDFRIAYDSKCREGIPPKSMKDTMTDPHENTIPMAWAYYVLEFWETCVIWPPQSRVYAKHPDLSESDKS